VDVVILGRSFSLGAQAEAPWPRQLADQTGLRVLNLSQTGSDIITKKDHLRKFGLPRQPRWIIVEVLPAMDILDYRPHPYLIIQDLPFPLVQGLARRLGLYSSQPSATPIYPLQVDIPGQTVKLAFFTYYLSELTVTQSMWQDSVQWQVFQSRLLDLVSMARSQSACVALLYAPTRPVIYFPLAQRPQQLAPALQGWSPWKLDSGRSLVQDSALEADLEQMQSNAPTARYLLADFARQHGLLWIDPSRALTEAAMKGDSPFMTYDSHWSAAGHRLVADLVGKALFEGACP
jgi:hypothetical protein